MLNRVLTVNEMNKWEVPITFFQVAIVHMAKFVFSGDLITGLIATIHLEVEFYFIFI